MLTALLLATTFIAAVPGEKPVDLLARIDVKRDAVSGGWYRGDAGQLEVKPGGGCKLQLPGDVPANYRLSLVATPKDDVTAMVAVGLVIEGKPVHLFLDHWQKRDGPDASGPSIGGSLPYQSLPPGTRHNGTLLISNKPNAIVYTVFNGFISVEVNGQTVLGWQNDPTTNDTRDWWATPNPKLLWIGCHSEKGIEFKQISITALPNLPQMANGRANAPGVKPQAGQPAANAPQPAQPAPAKKKINQATARLIQSIKRLGGDVELDETLDQPIVKILLAGSKATDALLGQFKSLSGLKHLDLENTSVTDKGIMSLATIWSLETLRIAGTTVTPKGMALLQKKLPQVQIIWEASPPSQAQIIQIVKELGGKVETEATAEGGNVIVQIDLSDAKQDGVTDAVLPYFRGLTELRVLRLSSKSITNVGISSLARLRNLEELRLDWASVDDDGLANVAQMVKLQDLVLHGMPMTDAGLAHLASLKNLRFLAVGETAVSGVGFRRLAGLAQLERVDLGPNTTDAGLAELAALKSLQDIYLGGRQNLTDVGIANLQRALPKLKIHN